MGIFAEVKEIETHFHSNECWFGKVAVPSAGVNEAEEYSLTPFQVDSGNNDWGTAICVLGTGNTPCENGKTYLDLNQFLVTATERTGLHYIRFTWGESEAAGIAAEHSTTVPFFSTATLRNASVQIQGKRIPAGTKVWANVKCASNTGTVDFVFGIHEYDS